MAHSTTELITIARPYAEALFRLAKETNSLDSWSDKLANLAAITANRDIRALISNPQVDRGRVAALISEIGSDALSEEARNLVSLLLENRRLEAIDEIRSLFEERKASAQGSVDAKVYAAYAVSPAEKAKIAAALKARLGREVNLSTQKDPSLLGGILIRAGDLVIDGSVRGQLATLAAGLNS